uniref:hypothetical protein n=1 Tax=Pseudomonas proteolytica TaxID=219574 RepID=UPI0030DB5935
VADRVFDPNAEDTQLGVAAVLIRLAEKRPDIHQDLYPTTETKPVDNQQSNDDVLLAAINGLRSDIAQLPAAIVAAIKGAVAPAVQTTGTTGATGGTATTANPAPAPVTATVTTTTPILDRPGVGIGVLGTVASAILSTLGVTGPM